MIQLDDVSLRYPLMHNNAHSLQKAVYGAVGGLIGSEKRGSPYVQALSEINLKVQDGERLAIVGHNGAGKTSLLRVLTGVYPPSTGKVNVVGSISALTDVTLGMEANASGLKNILFRLVFMGRTFEEAKRATEAIVSFSELGDFIELPVHTYSTGMYLRLAFSIATHFPPDILILDEVIGAGDEGFRKKALERIEALLERSRIVVLSSHDLGSLKKYCDRGIMLDHGKIVHQGKIDDTIEYYLEKTSLLSQN